MTIVLAIIATILWLVLIVPATALLEVTHENTKSGKQRHVKSVFGWTFSTLDIVDLYGRMFPDGDALPLRLSRLIKRRLTILVGLSVTAMVVPWLALLLPATVGALVAGLCVFGLVVSLLLHVYILRWWASQGEIFSTLPPVELVANILHSESLYKNFVDHTGKQAWTVSETDKLGERIGFGLHQALHGAAQAPDVVSAKQMEDGWDMLKKHVDEVRALWSEKNFSHFMEDLTYQTCVEDHGYGRKRSPNRKQLPQWFADATSWDVLGQTRGKRLASDAFTNFDRSESALESREKWIEQNPEKAEAWLAEHHPELAGFPAEWALNALITQR